MSENFEYQPWMSSPWVSTLEDYNDNGIEDMVDPSKIAWFDVKLDLSETEQEKKEKIQAIQEQIKMGVLQPNGFPVGMNVPPGAFVPGAIKRFNFPGAIGIPLPQKFSSSPTTNITKQPQQVSSINHTKINAMSNILKSLSDSHKGNDKTIFQKGEEKLRRIQELTRDRRK